jgi:hypothetical protein
METSLQGAVGAGFEKAVGLMLSPVLITAWMAVVTEDRCKPLEMDTVGHSGKASRHGGGKLHDCPRDVKRSKPFKVSDQIFVYCLEGQLGNRRYNFP